MRLLDVKTYVLHTFYGERIPPYAILSHTWLQDDQEVTFTEIYSEPMVGNPLWLQKRGAAKIKFLCVQAARDGYNYAWIDTCCIDKTNSSELSEAINSMYQWYEKSEVCYAYLEDVESEREFLMSRWWTRAWTLQELLAPNSVIFYDAYHRTIGSKASMAKIIASSVGIDERTLRNPHAMFLASVARRMSWAAHRQASRAEDLAYSLLGIFEINMPMQYGEGEKAFVRLQREIMRTTNDHSLFAWGFSPLPLEAIIGQDPSAANDSDQNDSDHASEAGLFAPHPRFFTNCGNVVAHSVLDHSQVENAIIDEKQGVFSIESESIIRSADLPENDILTKLHRFHRIVLLPCSIPEAPHSVLGILLRLWHWHHHDQSHPARALRDGLRGGVYTFPISSEFAMRAQMKKYMIDPLSWVIRFQNFAKNDTEVRSGSAIRRTLMLDCRSRYIAVHRAWQPRGWQWNPKEASLLCLHDGLSSNELTLRFSLKDSRSKEARWALFAALRLGSNIYETDKVTIRTIPSAQIDVDLSANQLQAGPHGSEYQRDGPFRLQSRELYGEIITRWIFNQAVTTFTIWDKQDWIAKERKLRPPIDEQRAGSRAVVAGAAVSGYALGGAIASFASL